MCFFGRTDSLHLQPQDLVQPGCQKLTSAKDHPIFETDLDNSWPVRDLVDRFDMQICTFLKGNPQLQSVSPQIYSVDFMSVSLKIKFIQKKNKNLEIVSIQLYMDIVKSGIHGIDKTNKQQSLKVVVVGARPKRHSRKHYKHILNTRNTIFRYNIFSIILQPVQFFLAFVVEGQ